MLRMGIEFLLICTHVYQAVRSRTTRLKHIQTFQQAVLSWIVPVSNYV